MTILLISTVRRHIPVSEPSGYLYAWDYEDQKVLQRTMIVESPYREWDNNPRGGLRGCRGISIDNEQVAIANVSYIYRFSPNWTPRGIISHPTCTAIHDILLMKDGIWVTSARNDLCAFLDFAGNMRDFIYFREHAGALKELGWRPPLAMNSVDIPESKIDFRDPRTNDDEEFNRAHVNSLCILENGDKLISMGLVLNEKFASLLKLKKWLYHHGYWKTILSVNRKIREILRLQKAMHSDLIVSPSQGKSAVVRIAQNGKMSLCLTLERINTPSHSLLALNNGSVIYLNTTKGEIVQFNPDSDHIISTTKITDGFLRGAAILPNGPLILGSRGELIVFSLNHLKILSSVVLTSDPNESVYDIKILPDHFSLPPRSLAEQVKAFMG
jgi:hypothetical protein